MFLPKTAILVSFCLKSGKFDINDSIPDGCDQLIDSDNDGLLSKKDIESVLCNSKAKSALTSADVDAVFEQIDLDGEGTLSLDQFLSYFARAETVVASNVSVGNEKASPTDSKRCGKGIFKSGQKGQRGAASKGLREEGRQLDHHLVSDKD